MKIVWKNCVLFMLLTAAGCASSSTSLRNPASMESNENVDRCIKDVAKDVVGLLRRTYGQNVETERYEKRAVEVLSHTRFNYEGKSYVVLEPLAEGFSGAEWLNVDDGGRGGETWSRITAWTYCGPKPFSTVPKACDGNVADWLDQHGWMADTRSYTPHPVCSSKRAH